MKQSHSWEANGFSASQGFPRILWKPKVRYCFHLNLFWARSIKSMPPHPTSWISTLILPSHLSLVLRIGLFPSGFPTKTLYIPLPSIIHASCFVYLILLDFVNRKILGEVYRSLRSSLCSLFHYPVISSSLGLKNILSTIFSDTLGLRSSFNVSNQGSHPYKTTEKIYFSIS